MGLSLTVTQGNFEAEVLRPSFEKPVIVDFFAQWCGPCQMLKPLLEKLSQEYDFVLAKVDIDQHPELAQQFGIEGVPDVRVAQNGQIMPGFVGMLPEPQLREFLAGLNLSSALERGQVAIAQAKATQNYDEAATLYAQLGEQFPDNHALRLEAAQFFLEHDRLSEAETAIAHIPSHAKGIRDQADAMRSLIHLHQDLQNPVLDSEPDRMYHTAAKAAVSGDYETALAEWLELVKRDRKYRQDGARKAMLMVFNLLGDDHPLTMAYRRKLMSALY